MENIHVKYTEENTTSQMHQEAQVAYLLDHLTGNGFKLHVLTISTVLYLLFIASYHIA